MSRLGGLVIWLCLVGSIITPASGQSISMDDVHECQGDSLRKAAASLEGRRCFASEQGWFLTTDSVWASRVSTSVREGAARFQKIFGEPIGRGVVLHILRDTTGTRETNDALKQFFPHAAWTYNLPVGLDQQQSAAEQLQAFSGLERHEMGHVWFGLWSKRHGAKSALHSWMLESPAILMEDSATTAVRYQNFKQLPAQGVARLIPLSELFTMPNPAADPQQQDMIQGEMFYDEGRLFFDFLVARTGDPGVFGAIALNEIRGSTVAEWLQASGPRYGLPTTVQELDEQWQRWLP